MKSYACIDRIEGKFAVCEVELNSVEESLQLSLFEKETIMIDFPYADILQKIHDVREADILVVEHDACNITAVYERDDEEKQRRVDAISALMSDA
mgnify:CR=1 FL=1